MNLTYLWICEKVVIDFSYLIIIKVAGFPDIFAHRVGSVLSLNPNYLFDYVRKVFNCSGLITGVVLISGGAILPKNI